MEARQSVTTRMHTARDCTICSSTMCASSAMSAVSAEESQEAWQLVSYVSDESVVLWELSLDMHTLCVDRKPYVSFVHREVVGERERWR